MDIPKKLEVWRNIHNRKVYTVLEIETTTESVFHLDGRSKSVEQCSSAVIIISPQEDSEDNRLAETENSRVSLREFMQHWERFNPKFANDSAPQSGETWQNIHTGYKAVIEFSNQKISWMQKGKKSTMEVKLFIANWRRIKTASQWFVGALNF